MSNLKVFGFEGQEVRVVMQDGQPWWIAKDVCDVLGLSNARDAVARLDEDEKDVVSTDTLGGRQNLLIVNEPGLYSLILGSRKPEAKAFKRWITHDVIPTIRRTGMYATDELLNNPDLLIAVATELKSERAARQKLELQVEADRPKVIFAEALETSGTSILIGELAKILKQNGIEIGQNRLFHMLRSEGYLGKKGEYYNIPTQRSMELKLFEIVTRTLNNPDGSVRTTRTTKVTGKGQSYFINKLKGRMAV